MFCTPDVSVDPVSFPDEIIGVSFIEIAQTAYLYVWRRTLDQLKILNSREARNVHVPHQNLHFSSVVLLH